MAQSEQEILEGLAEIVNEETGLDTASVEMDKSFTEDLDIDSLSMMQIVGEMETELNVMIPDEDLVELITVGDLVSAPTVRPSATSRLVEPSTVSDTNGV